MKVDFSPSLFTKSEEKEEEVRKIEVSFAAIQNKYREMDGERKILGGINKRQLGPKVIP